MAYKILYGETGCKRYKMTSKGERSKSSAYMIVLFLAVALFVGWVMNRQTDSCYATEAFLRDLYQGESFTDAITTFCRDIIESAGVVG